MAEFFPPKPPRINPYWAYRDPVSGKWLTLMTSAQCEQLAHPVFSPKIRRTTDTSSVPPQPKPPNP
jgi:hypothetical protein